MNRPLLLAPVALLALSCHKDSDLDPTTLPWEALSPVHGVPNIDDDDQNGTEDWDDEGVAEDDSLSALVVPAELVDAGTLELDLGGEADAVRVWHEGEVILDGASTSWSTEALEDRDAGEDLVLEVELADFLSTAELSVSLVDEEGVELASTTVSLQAAPLTLNHHRQEARRVFVMRVKSGSYNNGPMIDDLQEIFGDTLKVFQGSAYSNDVWVQDEIEFGWLWGEDTSTELIVDSIRSSHGMGLDNLAEDQFEGPDVVVRTWGRSNLVNSLDSFGNLETTPPTEDYPLGRIYFGGGDTLFPSRQLFDFLASQRVQAPVQPDSSWLCVGHVDEFMSFLPDPSAPRGFRLYITDVDKAWEVLESMDPATPIPHYTSAHGYSTVGELLDDTALRAMNEEVQEDQIEPVIELWKQELGLSDAEIVRVPQIWEHNRYCGNYEIALHPGLINMLVAPVDGTTHLVMADPFLRDDGEPQSEDPMIAAYEALLPEDAETHYVDDWVVYHEGMGEVHCGTNTRRKPPLDDWWTVATSLLEEGR